MKNLSISMKLIVGFGIVLILLVLSGVMALININNINTQVEQYAQYTVPNAEHVRVMETSIHACLHELGGALMQNSEEDVQTALDSYEEYHSQIAAELEEYKANQRNTDRDADIAKIAEIISDQKDVGEEIADLALEFTEESEAKALELYLNEYKPAAEDVIEILNGFADLANVRAENQRVTAAETESTAQIVVFAVVAISVIITIVVIIFIRKSILVPVTEIVGVYEEIAKGNMHTEISYESRDEIGHMAKLIHKTNQLQSGIISDLSDKLLKLSQGDLRISMDLEYPGDYSVLKSTMESTVYALDNTMQIINTAAEQVSTGADQVSSGAQALAAGSTEQASSVEELAVSIGKIAEQAEANSSNVKIANDYVGKAGAGVHAGNEHMLQLTTAMDEISTSSNQIVSVTKVIEDIAFQTNILALNAATEAARAGNAGKGFAVVADEVRNLAGKSAAAAKQTAELIQNSVETVSRGAHITEQTADILKEVGENAQKVTDSFGKIERASAEQAMAIEQIKQGLDQVSAVVQTNAATAEENSATSEEMSAQAVTLREEVGKFRLTGSGGMNSISLLSRQSASIQTRPAASSGISGFGKY